MNKKLLEKMADAGCYRVYYGIESGNQKILDNICKQIKLEQVENAVRWAKEAGMEVFGFFMIALPGETEKTMRDTIDFAKKLDLDLVKMSITMPLPGTRLYDRMKEKGLIKSNQWSKFNFYIPPREVFDHENLDWDRIEKYYRSFYREFYFRPRYILKRFLYGLKYGTLLSDLKTLVSTNW